MPPKREKSTERLTHAELQDLLAVRYRAPEYCFLRDVASATGYGAARTADGIAVSLWPSRGLEVLGFEAKASRSDWLRELRDPQKADVIASYCDRWYIVAPADVVNDGELPQPWGLLIASKAGLRQSREAARLTHKGLDRNFIAALMRRFGAQQTLEGERTRVYAEGRKAGQQDFHETWEKRVAAAEERAETLQRAISDFEKASGVGIGRWADNKRIGEAVRVVLDGGAGNVKRQLADLRDRCRRILDGLESAVDGLPPDAVPEDS